MMWNTTEKLLKQKNISIYRLSKITGIPQTTLRNYRQHSEPSFINACKIADALGVSLDDLREDKNGNLSR